MLCLNTLPLNLLPHQAKAASETGTITVSVDLTTTIAMTIKSNSDSSTIEAGSGITSAAAGTLLPSSMIDNLWSNITVYTNSASGYKLTVSDTDADTSLASYESTIPSGSTIEAGTSAWGIKGGLITDYSAIVAQDQAMTVAQSESRTERGGDATNMHYAISTSADQGIGDYETTIVYTLTAANDIPDVPESHNAFGITYMHEMTPTVCAQVPTPANTATMLDKDGEYLEDTANYVQAADLIDARDGKTYTVVKLADGNCWMNQDLELVLGVAASGSNIGTEMLTPAYSDVEAAVIPVDAEPRPDGYSWSGNVDAWNTYNDPTYGMYYNWYAATAGSGTSTTIGEAPESICPRGWKLPGPSSSSKSYRELFIHYTQTAWVFDATAAPLNFRRNGIISSQNGYPNVQGEQARYATSVGLEENKIQTMYQWGPSGMSYEQDTISKTEGTSVRCIAR